jgi:hypothetical protein
MNEIASIVIGFALSTLIGGWWAARLQARAWEHQNDVRLSEAEIERAAAVCRDVSQLLDRRLYRMRRLFWAIKRLSEGNVTESVLNGRIGEYDQILYEWNDNLNVHLSAVGTHFGAAARGYLDESYERYRTLGTRLERCIGQVRQGGEVLSDLREIDVEFEGWKADSLNHRNYTLGLAMMGQLRDGTVGRKAPADSTYLTAT